jgi:hypothetical protein
LALLVKELTRLGFNLQLQAIDDESQLHNLGYEFQKRRTRSKAPHPPLTALTGFEVTNCDQAGVVSISATRRPGAFGYQFQFTDREPSVEENWNDAGTFRGSLR